MSMTNRKANEQLMDAIGAVDEQYIREYMEVRDKMQNFKISGGSGRF